jgi:hypothetical protein
MQTEKLIESLIEQTRHNLNKIEKLRDHSLASLNWRADSTSWSILECLEHLNLYGDFYLSQISERIRNSNTKADPEFNSGFLGNYFAKSMLPKQKLNKMKTFKDKNPLNARLDKKTIDKCIQQQIVLLDLLDQSRKVSLSKVRIQTSISKLISLKLGDTFSFFINHIIRHLKQIERIELATNDAASHKAILQ